MVNNQQPNTHGNDNSCTNLNLKIGTYNIRGQGAKSEVKLRKIKNSFSKGNYDIFFLQETRSTGDQKEIKKWQKIFNTKQVFLTSKGTDSVGETRKPSELLTHLLIQMGDM